MYLNFYNSLWIQRLKNSKHLGLHSVDFLLSMAEWDLHTVLLEVCAVKLRMSFAQGWS